MKRYSSNVLARQEGLGRTSKLATGLAVATTALMTSVEFREQLYTTTEVEALLFTITAGAVALGAEATAFFTADHVERTLQADAAAVTTQPAQIA